MRERERERERYIYIYTHRRDICIPAEREGIFCRWNESISTLRGQIEMGKVFSLHFVGGLSTDKLRQSCRLLGS